MPNVLVVEADAVARNLMIRVLSGQGYTVYEAVTAAEAITLCQSLADEPLDLLIADHATSDPLLNETILSKCANTKVLNVSGWPIETVQRERALLPGSSFLQKPFTAGELLHSVQTLLSPRMQ